jgi:hypothetical protein
MSADNKDTETKIRTPDEVLREPRPAQAKNVQGDSLTLAERMALDMEPQQVEVKDVKQEELTETTSEPQQPPKEAPKPIPTSTPVTRRILAQSGFTPDGGRRERKRKREVA